MIDDVCCVDVKNEVEVRAHVCGDEISFWAVASWSVERGTCVRDHGGSGDGTRTRIGKCWKWLLVLDVSCSM